MPFSEYDRSIPSPHRCGRRRQRWPFATRYCSLIPLATRSLQCVYCLVNFLLSPPEVVAQYFHCCFNVVPGKVALNDPHNCVIAIQQMIDFLLKLQKHSMLNFVQIFTHAICGSRTASVHEEHGKTELHGRDNRDN